MSSLKDIMDELPPARRKKVEERAQELIAEEMSLRKCPRYEGNHKPDLRILPAELMDRMDNEQSRIEKST